MVPLKRAAEKFPGFIAKLTGQRRIRRSLAAVIFFVLMTLLISVDIGTGEVNLHAGEVAPRDIEAQRSIVFKDEARTNKAKQEAKDSIEKQYKEDSELTRAIKQDFTSLFETVKNVQNDKNSGPQEKIQQLKAKINFYLPESVWRDIAGGTPAEVQQLESGLKNLVNRALEEGITVENYNQVLESLTDQAKNLSPGTSYTRMAEKAIHEYIRPNYFYDKAQTQFLQQAAMDAVPPVMVSVKKGEIIVERGEIVTEEDMAKLEALGLTNGFLPFKSLIGTLLMVVLLMTVVLFYLYQQNREIYQNAGHIYLLGLVVAGVLAIGKAIMAIELEQWPQLSALYAYMVPVASAGMLIAMLLDSRLAVLVVSIMSLLLGIMTGGQIQFAVGGLIGGITGVYSVSKLSQRGDLIRAGMYVSLANIAAIFAMGLVSNASTGVLLASSLGMGVINGILSSILTNGALPYLENTFSITSTYRLLELSHPSNPLLRRLLTEAPGTYHHSIQVGNLAESAAGEVGGEPLLARVGAYYHDIGKLKRPLFFIENQMGAENPHDKIAPSLSTLIITAHVKDGVEMARESKIPQNIIDIIEQHHGTTLCSYFYQRALESGRRDNISEEDFRHDGPKPQSKEAALVMLADSVEAAVRSMQKRMPGKVEGTVHKIIKDKLMDGQLDESDLTLKDLDTIANAFLRGLSGVLHTRIEYPDASEVERGKSKNASTRKQLARKNGSKR